MQSTALHVHVNDVTIMLGEIKYRQTSLAELYPKFSKNRHDKSDQHQAVENHRDYL